MSKKYSYPSTSTQSYIKCRCSKSPLNRYRMTALFDRSLFFHLCFCSCLYFIFIRISQRITFLLTEGTLVKIGNLCEDALSIISDLKVRL